jgi:DNA-binding beta-propeller fold protein YncE
VAASTVTSTAAPAASSGCPAPVVEPAAHQESPLKLLWQTGGPTTASPATFAPAIDPAGRIWVAASRENTFWIFSATGTFLEGWGVHGSADGQFDFQAHNRTQDPYGAVAFDPDGTTYVVDVGNDRVEKFDKQRRLVLQWGGFGSDDGEFVTPGSIASDGHGHVYVADTDRYDIQEFTSNGKFVRSLGTGEVGQQDPVGWVTTDAAGHVYTDEGQSVVKYDADGSCLADFDLAALVTAPLGIAVDPKGDIYVASETSSDNNALPESLIELDAKGKLLHDWPATGETLALDPGGKAIYIAFFTWASLRKYALPTG